MSGQQSWQSDEQQWLECGKCGEKNIGECRARTTACYKCGKEGHFIKDCPLLSDDPKREEPKKSNVRVFTITQADTEAGTSGYWGKQILRTKFL